MTNNLPVLGVALNTSELDANIGLVRNHERDVELQDFVTAQVLEGDWRPIADRALRLLDGHKGRLGIHGPFWDFSLGCAEPGLVGVIRNRLDQGLDVVEHLGATHMVIHSPVKIWDCHHFPVMPGAFDRLRDAFQANVSDAVTRAAMIGCQLVVENIEDLDPALRLALLDGLDPAGIAVSIDTGHANYTHTMHGAPPVDAFVHAAGERLAHVHVQDSDGRADRHWLPGQGNIPWDAVFRAFHESTTLGDGGLRSPRLMIEVKDKTRLQEGIDYLAELDLAV